MKHLLYILTLIVTTNTFACNFQDLSVPLDSFINDLVPKDCNHETDYFMIEDACECAKEQISTFNPTIDIIDNKRKKVFLDTLSEKANMGLLSIANDIVAVSTQSPELSNNKELGQKCSIKNIKNITCPNSDGILTPTELNTYTSKLYQKFHDEIDARYADPDISKGLVNRVDVKNDCGVSIPDSFTSRLKKEATQNMSSLLFQNDIFQSAITNSSSLQDSLVQFSKDSSDDYRYILSEVRSTPHFKSILNDKELFNSLKANINETNFPALAAAEITSKDYSKEITSDIENRCNILQKEMKEILCSSSDNLIPSDSEILRPTLLTAQEKDDFSSTSLLASSMILNKQCTNKTSSKDYDKHFEKLQSILPPKMQGLNNFKDAISQNYGRSILATENLVCKFFDKSKPLDILANIRKACDNGELSKDCIYAKTAQAMLTPQVNRLITDIEEKVFKEVKDNGIKENTPEFLEQFTNLVTKAKAAIKIEDIFNPSTKKPIVVQAFQGASDREIAISASSANDNVDVRSPITGDSSSVVMDSAATSSGQISNYFAPYNGTKAASGEVKVARNYNELVRENTNDVFSEVARRITQAKQTSTPKAFQRKLDNILRPPVNRSRESGSSQVASSAPNRAVPFNPQVDPFIDRPEGQYFVNNSNQLNDTQDYVATENNYNEEYNKALLDTAASQKAMAAYKERSARAFPKAGAKLNPSAKGVASSGAASRGIASSNAGSSLLRPDEVKISEGEMSGDIISLNTENADKVKVFLENANSKAINLFFSKGEEFRGLNSAYQITILKNDNGSFEFKHTENELDARFMMFFDYIKRSFNGNNLSELVREINAKASSNTPLRVDKSSAPTYEALRDTF